MKCKKCKKTMRVDIDNQRYVCKCGREIKWMDEDDLRKDDKY